MTGPDPQCYFCLTYDVAIKIRDLVGFDHWVCAECDAENQRLRDWIANIIPDKATS